MAAVLSSMRAGASVHCSPGFDALKAFRWFDEVKPSWYTAVPTMHQAILARAGRNAEIVAGTRLRFIRSSSSSLPPQVMAELEKRSEEHTSELQSLMRISYAVFCLKKKQKLIDH